MNVIAVTIETMEARADRVRFGLGVAVALTGAVLWLAELTHMPGLASVRH